MNHNPFARPASGTLPGRLIGWALVALLLGGCVSQTVKRVDTTPARQATEAIPEALLLDVGIQLFDPNVPEEWRDRERDGILPEVRRAEARFMPFILKDTLESTGNWGAVRVVPRETLAVDLTVNSRILESNGETLRLEVEVSDASGRRWFKREYSYQASRYAYDEAAPAGLDPFQMVYNEIANDMLAYRERMSAAEIAQVREIGRMRFAREFAPEAFDGYLQENRGRYELLRLPAENDPMMTRIARVREREHLFIDTLDAHYAHFNGQMDTPYTEYRRHTYREAVALREMRESARNRTIMGALAVAGGIYAASQSDSSYGRAAGHLGILGGAYMIRDGLGRRQEAELHALTLNELANSLEQEITPSVIELDDRTITLTGTVDGQYDQWREILHELYQSDVGLPVLSDG
ncbi:MAG: hypothetical protein JJU22_04445 [Gammaproteobacteria bacterium]|nr:hypothetical protein [Gammaproteobacteria bacterium]